MKTKIVEMKAKIIEAAREYSEHYIDDVPAHDISATVRNAFYAGASWENSHVTQVFIEHNVELHRMAKELISRMDSARSILYRPGTANWGMLDTKREKIKMAGWGITSPQKERDAVDAELLKTKETLSDVADLLDETARQIRKGV